jgi:uncharacterized protein (DUF983 family)
MSKPVDADPWEEAVESVPFSPCPECGEHLDESDDWCNHCGWEIEEEEDGDIPGTE